MSESIIDKINNGKFSKSHKKIALFIKNNYKRAAFMTAAKLANETDVSEATVVRFANAIGFEGYHEFLKQLREETKSSLTTIQRMEIASEHLRKDSFFHDVMKSDIEKIEKTRTELDVDSFNSCVSGLLTAEKIYVVGVRSSAPLAMFLGFYLNLILENVKIITCTGAEDITEQLFHVTDMDVVIGISFPRYSSGIVKALAFARTKGAYIVALTDSKSSPIVQTSSCVLLARSDMNSFADSLVAPMSVLNALIFAVGYSNKEQTEKTFDELEQIWNEYEVYDK